MNKDKKVKSLECGMSIADKPEDVSYEELLCDSCYEDTEEE